MPSACPAPALCLALLFAWPCPCLCLALSWLWPCPLSWLLPCTLPSSVLALALPTVAGSRGGSSSGSGSSSASRDRTANSSKELSIKITCITSPWITLFKQASLEIVPHFLEHDPFGAVQLAHTDVVYVFVYGYTLVHVNSSSVATSTAFCSFVCISRLLQCDLSFIW